MDAINSYFFDLRKKIEENDAEALLRPRKAPHRRRKQPLVIPPPPLPANQAYVHFDDVVGSTVDVVDDFKFNFPVSPTFSVVENVTHPGMVNLKNFSSPSRSKIGHFQSFNGDIARRSPVEPFHLISIQVAMNNHDNVGYTFFGYDEVGEVATQVETLGTTPRTITFSGFNSCTRILITRTGSAGTLVAGAVGTDQLLCLTNMVIEEP